MAKTIIEEYVPRHIRVGCHKVKRGFAKPPTHDVVGDVPIIDDNGNVVQRVVRNQLVDAVEDMAKYKDADFKLENLIGAGVPLRVINVDRSQLHDIDELERIANNLDGLEHLASQVAEMKKREESWLEPAVVSEPGSEISVESLNSES